MAQDPPIAFDTLLAQALDIVRRATPDPAFQLVALPIILQALVDDATGPEGC